MVREKACVLRLLLTTMVMAIGNLALTQTVHLNGGAINISPNCFQLTDSLVLNQSSSVWIEDSLDLDQPFDMRFQVFQQNVGIWGGDGVVFVMHRDPAKWNALGPIANGIGYAGSLPPTTPAISPSFAVEIDLWDNSASGADDIPEDHIALVRNGDQTAVVQGPPVPALPGGANITDGTCREFRIRWQPATDSFFVYFNHQLRIAVQEDIRAGFGGQPVYYGLAGASGGSSLFQAVCFDFVDAGRDTFMCEGTSVELMAYGGLSYTWSPSANLDDPGIRNPVFTPPAPGAYGFDVTGDNSLGCQDHDSITVDVIPLPTADAAATSKSVPVTVYNSAYRPSRTMSTAGIH